MRQELLLTHDTIAYSVRYAPDREPCRRLSGVADAADAGSKTDPWGTQWAGLERMY